MSEPELEAAPAEEAPAPAPAEEPEPAGPHDVALSAAQISEIWKSPSADTGLALMARCLAMPEDYEEDLRSQIWVDLLYGVVDFCKGVQLTPQKAKAYLNVMTALHATSIETKCSKEEAFGTFKDALLSATKSLPLSERFSLEEVRRLTDHATTSYLSSIKLHQLVFTEEQTVRESEAEFFLQTPAVPPPTDAAVDPDALPPPEAEDEAAAPPAAEPAPPEPEAVLPAAEPAAEEAPAPAMGEPALTEAIAATISSQVAAHQSQLAAEFAAQEQTLLDRIGALESKLA